MWMWKCGGGSGRRVCVTPRWVQRGCCYGDRRPASEAAVGATSQRPGSYLLIHPVSEHLDRSPTPRPIVHLGAAPLYWRHMGPRVKGRKKLLYLYGSPQRNLDNVHGRSCFSAMANCCLNKFRPSFSLAIFLSCFELIVLSLETRQIQSSNSFFIHEFIKRYFDKPDWLIYV